MQWNLAVPGCRLLAGNHGQWVCRHPPVAALRGIFTLMSETEGSVSYRCVSVADTHKGWEGGNVIEQSGYPPAMCVLSSNNEPTVRQTP